MTKQLYLIRHGEVPEEYRHGYIGVCDPPLGAEGRACLSAVGERLSGVAFDRVWSSPLRRARESAELVAGNRNRIEVDSRLGEICFGEWENRTYEDLRRTVAPELMRVWFEEPGKMVFPGGDSVAGFWARIDDFMEFLSETAFTRAAVVTHGGVIMRMLCRIRGVPENRQFDVLPPRGGVTELAWTPETGWHDAGNV